jgi:nucleoside-diphosphate-sugar epimerase
LNGASIDSSIGESYRDQPVLVLGASGFIGRWVARRLCDHGAIVHLVVRDRAAASKLFAEFGIVGDVIEADLSRADAGESVVAAARPAIVFNLAGYGVDRSERDEPMLHAINTALVMALAEAVHNSPAGTWRGQRLVQAGSAAEYGQIRGRLDEERAPDVLTRYGASKLAATEYLRRNGASRGLRAVTARLFTVYGPGEHEGRLLPTLLEAAARGRPVDLTSGYQQRDFTYVEDAAEGLVRLGVSAAGPGEVVNLATGRLTSVREFAEKGASLLDIDKSLLNFGAAPVRSDEMFHDAVVIDRLRALTHWVPTISVAEGIRRTRDFHQAHGCPHD